MTINLIRVSDGKRITVDSQRVADLLRLECVPEDEYESEKSAEIELQEMQVNF